MFNTSSLHYHLIRHIIDHGHGPENEKIAEYFNVDIEQVTSELKALQDLHGVVLHPNDAKVWVIHPFSLAPTHFFLTSGRQKWWSNCAWCSLGAAALIDKDLSIHTSLGFEGEKVEIQVKNRVIQEELVVHFPLPMTKAWDNVIYTCSTMLFFKSESVVDEWCEQHQIPKGDVQPISKIWPFARKWYGNHLNPEWKKWTVEEAQGIFEEFGLTHPVWKLEGTAERF